MLAADGVVEVVAGAQAVAGAAQEPAGTATKGQLVAVPGQAAWAQTDQSLGMCQTYESSAVLQTSVFEIQSDHKNLVYWHTAQNLTRR